MSQRRLARESGVSDCVLSKWERIGLERAQLGLVVRVARALGVPVEDLYSDEWGLPPGADRLPYGRHRAGGATRGEGRSLFSALSRIRRAPAATGAPSRTLTTGYPRGRSQLLQRTACNGGRAARPDRDGPFPQQATTFIRGRPRGNPVGFDSIGGWKHVLP